MLMFLGIMGWGVGGIAAVIDSTVEVNFHFHNTLWVPAHFHTYYLMGGLIILGFIDHAGKEISGLEEIPWRKLTVVLLLIGGYGFLSMFYWGGAHSVPRRYAIYPLEVAQGNALCQDCGGIHFGCCWASCSRCGRQEKDV